MTKYIKTTLLLLGLATSALSSRLAGCDGKIWQPQPGMPWMWQIGTTPTKAQIDATNAQVIDLDMFGTDASLIDYIHSKGKAMICYIDTQYEPGRPDSSSFTAAVKGAKIQGWPGQLWVDIRSPVVWNIMINRAKQALAKGCDGIEWDDVDGYANANGLKLQYADQIAFNRFLANLTHSLGMSVGLKNDLDQVNDLVNWFDWALNEECYAFKECTPLQAFIKQGKAVFGTEYTDSQDKTGTPSQFCPTQNKAGYSWLQSTLDLDGTGVTQCCSFNSPACAPVNYTCAAPNPAGYPYTIPAVAPHASSENLPSTAAGLSHSVALLFSCLLFVVVMMM